MGNANGREDGAIAGAGVDPSVRVAHAPDSRPPVRAFSSDSMANSPPQSPRRSRSPILFGPQVLSLNNNNSNNLSLFPFLLASIFCFPAFCYVFVYVILISCVRYC